METKGGFAASDEVVNFKSHHSGMETSPGLLKVGSTWSFKSHHSGMETDPPGWAGLFYAQL